MSNMVDYLIWRGDLTLEQVPFGEMDNLILSQLAYLHWENGLNGKASGVFSELFECMSENVITHGVTEKDDRLMVPLAAKSARFGSMTVCHYVHERDEEQEKQFAAVTFLLPDGTAFLSFRGTDGTMVGWKEDFNMSFVCPVPAQISAQQYLVEVLRDTSRPLRLGGHSKGGNLAVYAAVTADESVQSQIMAIYSNDGPGLTDELFNSDSYKKIESRIFSFVPQSSIVGMLLAHPENYAVVQSKSVSIFQHNPYMWQVLGGGFVKESTLHKGSVTMENVIKGWLQEMSDDERRCFIDSLFSVFEATNAENFGREILTDSLRHPSLVFNAVRGLSPESRKTIMRALSALITAVKEAGEKQKAAEKAGTALPQSDT